MKEKEEILWKWLYKEIRNDMTILIQEQDLARESRDSEGSMSYLI